VSGLKGKLEDGLEVEVRGNSSPAETSRDSPFPACSGRTPSQPASTANVKRRKESHHPEGVYRIRAPSFELWILDKVKKVLAFILC